MANTISTVVLAEELHKLYNRLEQAENDIRFGRVHDINVACDDIIAELDQLEF